MSRRSLEDPVVSFRGVDKILTYVGASSIPEAYTLSIILSYTLSLNNIIPLSGASSNPDLIRIVRLFLSHIA